MNTTKSYLPAIGIALALAAFSALAQAPSTFQHITIDGSFADWTPVPVAYTAPIGPSNAVQYENIYVANDQKYLYLRITLYSPANLFSSSDIYDNIWMDADDNIATGFLPGGGGHVGSDMLIQGGAGYEETSTTFNAGGVNGLDWAIASSPDNTDFEMRISFSATYADDGSNVFTSPTIAFALDAENSSFASVDWAPATGGISYTIASPPVPPAANLALVTLTNSSWEANASSTDLGTNWLGQNYDDTQAGWIDGLGLFGYTPAPASYPPIQTPLASGPETYYFRTHFQWTNDPLNVAFVATNFLSDGAVYYLNGTEVARVRMPAGAVSYATAAAGTNSPTGQPGVFGISGDLLLAGDNILEVETHQAAGSLSDMVFGLSLTAAVQFPVYVVDTNQPANQTVLAGQPATFTSDVIGSGPLYYQWFFAGGVIDGATNAAYTIPLVLTNNAGAYDVVVSNSLLTLTSRVAVLTGSNIPAAIATQPSNQVAVEGGPVTFNVGVSGTPLFLYQWFFGTNAIPAATNASYAIASAAPANSGLYYVNVSNPAGATNSRPAMLTVLLDTIPPAITAISAMATQLVVTFSKPVDAASAGLPANYAISGGVSVSSAAQNPSAANQVILTTGAAMNFGTIYALSVNGVNDLFGNPAATTASFARAITIDGSFDDWQGMAPLYSGPSGNDGAADFAAIYVYDDANSYYFRVTLWHDIPPASGQFPDYVNMFFNTDDNLSTGYDPNFIGSELLVQSGFSYQEKNGGFNEGSIDNLNWLCLPSSPGTNFEFSLSKAATFDSDGTPVFTTNLLSFIFQGQTPAFVFENQAPVGGGVITYTNAPPLIVPPLPLGKLAVNALSGGNVAIIWDPPGTLQSRTSLTGGSWTNLPPASSPYVIPASGASQFFRLAP